MSVVTGNQPIARPPRILPDHLLRLTKRELAFRALASGFLGWFGWALLNVGLPGRDFSPLLVWTCAIVVLAPMRNRILSKVYSKVTVRFGVHCWFRTGLASALSLFAIFVGMMIGSVLSSSTPVEPAIAATILGIGFVAVATGFPIPPILADKGEASLLFAQSAFELNARSDLTHALRWSDRGVYVLRRFLNQYGMTVGAQTLRLGTRLYCLEKKEAKILEYISQAILQVEDPDQFLVLKESLQTLEAVGRDAISKGISPRPRLEDYLDYRYLSLENIYRILFIISVILAVLYYLCWILKIPACALQHPPAAISIVACAPVH